MPRTIQPQWPSAASFSSSSSSPGQAHYQLPIAQSPIAHCPFPISHPSGSSCELSCFGVYLHSFAFFDEERDTNLESGLERGKLRDAAACRIAAYAGLGRRHGELDVRRKLKADRRAVVLLDLNRHVVDEQLP